jgi:hypothetical protein
MLDLSLFMLILPTTSCLNLVYSGLSHGHRKSTARLLKALNILGVYRGFMELGKASQMPRDFLLQKGAFTLQTQL